MSEKSLSGEVFYPSKEVIKYANAKCDELYEFASKDLQGFWEREAKNLKWFKKWDKVLDDSNRPFYKWFTGAKVNIVHNCIDAHLKTHRKNKLAFIWEGENGESWR
jgi:acetyl-CoA synthetase